ncbi:hypothetical protein [Thalassotalea piscium]|uniref:LysM domain-containing protein n=1 Tax=Thalassotalea piscium TaxID=1230533 RepID=A0A7X0NGY6_9GAMM|nr:hypothetical protein [Thalassotalea piscium]MBB6543170.1 hypothetical protein [Thalassotalea piscium]
MLARILSLLFLVQISALLNTAYAQIDYVSLHDIESPERAPLFLKLNIVGSGQNLPLKFTLLSQSTETEMAAHRLNTFMVRLASLRPAIGESYILVYEFNGQAWAKVQQVDVSNELKSTTNTPSVIITNNNQQHAVPVSIQPSSTEQTCLLEREPKETLWSIANRYKDNWRVNVFSAMIAIFNTNKSKFNQGHIGHLMDNESLTCPSRKSIAMRGEKEAMRAEFFRLNELPF